MHNQATPNSNPVVNAIKKVQNSVVSVVVTKEIPDDLLKKLPLTNPSGLPFPQVPKQDRENKIPHDHERVQVGGGSGFIISKDGLILTNKHVVRDPTATYSVVLNSENVLPAKIISRDPINDIAVLKIESEEDLPVAPLGSSSSLQLGDTLIAIGNALGTFRNTVSVGVVSGLSRFLSAHDGIAGTVAHLRGLIQTDAAINPGNSGGPLVGVDGKAVGISVATVMGAENIGFAIPIDSAKKDLEDIKKYGYIRKPFLGVRYLILNEKIKDRLGLEIEKGAYIIAEDVPGDEAVVEGSPAHKAGLREEDIIIDFNGQKIDEKITLQDVLEKCEVGQEVKVRFLRKGQEDEVTIKLTERT